MRPTLRQCGGFGQGVKSRATTHVLARRVILVSRAEQGSNAISGRACFFGCCTGLHPVAFAESNDAQIVAPYYLSRCAPVRGNMSPTAFAGSEPRNQFHFLVSRAARPCA